MTRPRFHRPAKPTKAGKLASAYACLVLRDKDKALDMEGFARSFGLTAAEAEKLVAEVGR